MPKDARGAFTYRVPEDLAPRIARGAFVRIPFRAKRLWGICTNTTAPPITGARDILAVNDDAVLTDDEIQSVEDIAALHGVSIATAAYLVLPAPPLTGAVSFDASYNKHPPSPGRGTRSTTPHDATALAQGAGDTIAVFSNHEQRIELLRAYTRSVLDGHKTILIITPHRAWLQRLAHELRDLPLVVFDPAQHGKRAQWAAYVRARTRPVCVLATRAGACFAPPILGAIIVDLAHEDDHQQEDMHPRYDARTITQRIAVARNLPRLLLSPAPNTTDWVVARKRVDLGAQPLALRIARLDQFWKGGGVGLLTHELHDAIRETLDARGRILILHNRRGRMGRVVCRDCGTTLQCPTCTTALTDFGPVYRCRVCGTTDEPALLCPACQSPQLGFQSIGTQGIVDLLRTLYPDAVITQVDRDQPDAPPEHADIIVASERFTTSIAPLFRNPIHLVAVLHAERYVRGDDYRGTEQLLQALRSIAVWASTWKASLLVQTALPDHPALQALRGPLTDFYRAELAERTALHYPPKTRLLRLDAVNPDDAPSLIHLLKTRYHGTVLAIDGPYEYGIVHKRRTTSILVRMTPDVANDTIARIVKDVPADWTGTLDPTKLHA
ncbi:MAG: hypothetical protein Q7S96_03445 [bacterium]|nr:hypothetical protein [bacterium]